MMPTTDNAETSPAAPGVSRTGAEDVTTSTHLAEGAVMNTLSPTSREIAELMRDMPGPGAPAGVRAAWCARKHELLAGIEEAKRR